MGTGPKIPYVFLSYLRTVEYKRKVRYRVCLSFRVSANYCKPWRIKCKRKNVKLNAKLGFMVQDMRRLPKNDDTILGVIEKPIITY